ncbi:hypothetical protein SAMN06295955_101353 [Sphingopyxis indica]|uniref:Uncharacterized protein n=2 Tax=Sphingopyxis indica TaxID=436663 RepID=A0A239DMM1_9SPHN|nr:hypothetical protein SAMN06295955_101353 [Sphingopyxis indica]
MRWDIPPKQKESPIIMKPVSPSPRKTMTLLCGAAVLATASACSRDNELDISAGVGVTQTRNKCPAVAVPLHTGDITLFDPAASRDASAIDVVATITNLTPQCNDTGEKIYQLASFDVVAMRREAGPARTVTLPYFATVVQGGTAVVAKRLGQVSVTFPEGQIRGTGHGEASAYVDAAAATLPADIQEQIMRKRKPGDADAAVDPLSLPEVKAAVQRASFELLVGFQLTQDQLEYNVRR